MHIFSYQCRLPHTSRAQDHKLIFAHAGVSRHKPLQPADRGNHHISTKPVQLFRNSIWLVCIVIIRLHNAASWHAFTFNNWTINHTGNTEFTKQKWKRIWCMRWNVEWVTERGQTGRSNSFSGNSRHTMSAVFRLPFQFLPSPPLSL